MIASWIHAGSYFNHSSHTLLAASHPECYIFSSPNLLCLKRYLTVSSVDCYSVSPDTWHLFKHPVFCSLIITAGIFCVVLFMYLRVKCFFTVGYWAVRFISMTDGQTWLLQFKMKWEQIKFHKYLFSNWNTLCSDVLYKSLHVKAWANLILFLFVSKKSCVLLDVKNTDWGRTSRRKV